MEELKTLKHHEEVNSRILAWRDDRGHSSVERDTVEY